jgi:hypothetical protein
MAGIGPSQRRVSDPQNVIAAWSHAQILWKQKKVGRKHMKSVRTLFGAVAVSALALTLAQGARADDWIIGSDIYQLTSGASIGDHSTYNVGVINDLLANGTTGMDYGKLTGGVFTPEAAAVIDPLHPFAYNVAKVDSYGAFGDTFFSYADPFAKSSWISVGVDPGPDGPGPAPLGTFTGEPKRLGNSYPDTFVYTTTFTVDKKGYYVFDGNFLSDDILQSVVVNNGTADAAALGTTNPFFTYRDPGTLSGGLNLKQGENTISFFVLNNDNDRSALDFSTKLTLVPEPGAVAFGTALMGGLLGLMGRARLRSRRSL